MNRTFVALFLLLSILPEPLFGASNRRSSPGDDPGFILWILIVLLSLGAWIVSGVNKTKEGVQRKFEKAGASNVSEYVASKTSGTLLGKKKGEKIITEFEELYSKYSRINLEEDPHYNLAMAWSAGMLRMNKNLNASEMQDHAFRESFLPACVSPPACARALGLYVLYKLNPKIIENHQEFQMEFSYLMGDVFRAMENNTLDELYIRFNPNMNIEDYQ